jgi:mono/diheme cytochrome c family protein
MQRKTDVMKKTFVVTSIACIAAFACIRGTAGTTLAMADAAATYKSKCVSCHGADGGGQTAAGKALKLKDLRSAEVQGMSDDQLLAIISKGKGKMPGYEKTLGAATCKALVAYVRQLKK